MCTNNGAYVFDRYLEVPASLRKGKDGIRFFVLTPLPDILISDKKQTFTRCRWFAPILSLSLVRGSFYHQRVAVFDYPLAPPKTKWEAVAYSTKGAARFFRQKIIADNKSQTAVIPCRSAGTPRGVSCAAGKDTEGKGEKQWVWRKCKERREGSGKEEVEA